MERDETTEVWMPMAGDYVLGVLSGAELHGFETALASSQALRDEVARCRLHYSQIGVALDEDPAEQGALGLLKREVWLENRLPWARRIRIWEYALGGIAAALLAYLVYGG